ncbi:MAG: hypothetical protein AAF517_08185 [Planctomycetota bacterium]
MSVGTLELDRSDGTVSEFDIARAELYEPVEKRSTLVLFVRVSSRLELQVEFVDRFGSLTATGILRGGGTAPVYVLDFRFPESEASSSPTEISGEYIELSSEKRMPFRLRVDATRTQRPTPLQLDLFGKVAAMSLVLTLLTLPAFILFGIFEKAKDGPAITALLTAVLATPPFFLILTGRMPPWLRESVSDELRSFQTTRRLQVIALCASVLVLSLVINAVMLVFSQLNK